MLIHGLKNAPDELLEHLSGLDDEGIKALASQLQSLHIDDQTLFYSLPGLPLCWKCTLKHAGQAVVFASELEKYPERIGCVVGELGHAYRECPDKQVAEQLHEAYQQILDTGCVQDLTPVLKAVSEGWRKSLAEEI